MSNLPSKEDPRHPVNYIYQASASSQDLCDANPALDDWIFGDSMSGNIPIYNFNEAEYESGRVSVVFHLTETKQSGVDINDLASRLEVGRDTALKNLEATT